MLEGRYFNSRPPEAAYNVANITTFRIAGIGVTILGGGPLNAHYLSTFQSAEANVHKQLFSGFSLLAGARWIDLKERLRVDIATPATFTSWEDTNRMYGGQFGASWTFFSPVVPVQLTATAKAGYFRNSASNQFTSTIVAGANGSASNNAFVGEFNLTAAYFLTERLSLQAGYTGLLVRDVAVADKAAQGTTQVAGGTSSPVRTDKVWFNGASARLGYAF